MLTLLLRVERIRADLETLRHLPDRVAPLSDLRDFVPLELIAELVAVHHGLLALKFAEKASTIHGAIHNASNA